MLDLSDEHGGCESARNSGGKSCSVLEGNGGAGTLHGLGSSGSGVEVHSVHGRSRVDGSSFNFRSESEIVCVCVVCSRLGVVARANGTGAGASLGWGCAGPVFIEAVGVISSYIPLGSGIHGVEINNSRDGITLCPIGFGDPFILLFTSVNIGRIVPHEATGSFSGCMHAETNRLGGRGKQIIPGGRASDSVTISILSKRTDSLIVGGCGDVLELPVDVSRGVVVGCAFNLVVYVGGHRG